MSALHLFLFVLQCLIPEHEEKPVDDAPDGLFFGLYIE